MGFMAGMLANGIAGGASSGIVATAAKNTAAQAAAASAGEGIIGKVSEPFTFAGKFGSTINSNGTEMAAYTGKGQAITGELSALANHASSYYQGRAQASQLETEATSQFYRGLTAQSQSNIAKYEGQIKDSDDYLEYYRAAGRQAAGQAQAGVLNSATGRSLRDELDYNAEKYRRRNRLKSQADSDSYLAESIGLMASVQGRKDQAKLAKMNGWLAPMGSTLGAMGSSFDFFKTGG